jgi:nondiscriminating glutamyl-tRNA synthetase
MTDGRLKLSQKGGLRVRIAPSPTGPFHIGTARTALFNYLLARRNNGAFVIRIEDTDSSRSKRKWEKDILDNLRWLSLDWDEGPEIGGPYGPYRQSERKEIYKNYIKKLLDEGKAYRCFCTPEELEAQRQYQFSIGQPPRYTGKCRSLTDEEVKEKLQAGQSFVVRLKVPSGEKVVFKDAVIGRVEFSTDELGDFVVSKGMDQPLYNLAVVIDDYEMKINYVVRGADHISNTPKQILIQKALGLSQPKYAHLPLVLSPEKRKLSKREAVVAVSDYQKEGYLPQALVNFIALLGWSGGEDKEIYSLSTLTERFSLDQIQKSGAVFDIKRLDWMNGYYIRQEPLPSLTKMCIPFLIKEGLLEKENHQGEEKFIPSYKISMTGEKINFSSLEKIVGLYQERLKKLSEIGPLTSFFFQEELVYEKELLIWKEQSLAEVKKVLKQLKKLLSKLSAEQWTEERIKSLLMEEAEKGKDRGSVLWPLRVTLTGQKQSAGPFEIATVLGKNKVLSRLDSALKKL